MSALDGGSGFGGGMPQGGMPGMMGGMGGMGESVMPAGMEEMMSKMKGADDDYILLASMIPVPESAAI